MAQLLDNENQGISHNEGEMEADIGIETGQGSMKRKRSMTQQLVHRRMGGKHFRKKVAQDTTDMGSEEEDKDDPPEKKNPMDDEQALLHLLSTEITINTRLHGEITCFRSEFDSWMPSLPHSTIFGVLRFFGLSPAWISFLKKFLEAPLKFIDDGETIPSRIRRRGVPGSHVLSEVLGEVILFCLDFSVNQRTGGTKLHRLHDDFWIWSPNHQTCVKAWEAVTVFADVMGVSINRDKTATVRIVRDNKTGSVAEVDPSLISGRIRWGFLYLDPVTGRFKIDQDVVDHHIFDLHRQLSSKTKSVFSWVQAWNTYATMFFSTNFGTPANCYGRDHVDQILSTFERIQRDLFLKDYNASKPGNVVEYLKTTLQERFGLTNIPDGYLFFPTELGGLELQSPFIGLLQIRDSLVEEPSYLMEEFEEAEEDAYVKAKKRFDNDKHARDLGRGNVETTPENQEVFMSFEEFTKYREEYSGDYEGELLDVFRKLLKVPDEEHVKASADVMTSLDVWRNTFSSTEHIGNWYTMRPYWKWVTQLYGPEMIEKFGALSVVNRGELPIGMVNLFRSGRVKWQG